MKAAKAHKYYCVDQVQNGQWEQVGAFTTKESAKRFQASLAGRTKVTRTWPTSSVHPHFKSHMNEATGKKRPLSRAKANVAARRRRKLRRYAIGAATFQSHAQAKTYAREIHKSPKAIKRNY